MKRCAIGLTLFLLGVIFSSCTVQSSLSNRYLTAEKLWADKNYAGAVAEFDRVVKEAPTSAMGLQSLWRATTTRSLFLNQPEEALKGFELFLERASSSELAPEAKLEIGEIYFSKLYQYQKAIEHYLRLTQDPKFSEENQAKFHYRIARSYLLTNQIKLAMDWFQKTTIRFPSSPFSDKAELDLANAWYAIGETDKTAYSKAQKLFQNLKNKIKEKNHTLYVEAIFGEASTLEEMDHFEDAYLLFKSIEADYPAPNVIKIRMIRLDERMKKKRK